MFAFSRIVLFPHSQLPQKAAPLKLEEAFCTRRDVRFCIVSFLVFSFE